jgi:CubicO group peptidase (beta-lactamase class C family)
MKPSRLICTVLLASICYAEEAPTDITAHPEVQGALAITDAWVDAIRDYREVPGISVGLVLDQELIFAKGYGYSNLRRKVPADADTIYSICSISKLFTSIGVMQMRDAGKLTLRDPVADHLEWFTIKQDHNSAGPTRIQGLLTHSSGLPRESDFPYWSDKDHPFPTRTQMIEQLNNQQTLYPADALFQYSNLGLSLAGEIVRSHAGVSYEEYVQAEILSPLGMTDTRPFFPDELHGKQMAVGYAGMQRDLKRKPLKPFHTQAIAPAAGFTSSVNDLAKFASWNFRTLSGESNDGVLDSNTLREMHRVHWVDPSWETTWGLGFAVRQAGGETVVGHGGACPGYITNLSMMPKHKVAVIVLTNAADGPAGAVAAAISKTVGGALKKATGPPAEAAKLDLEKYEGSYSSGIWGGETLIRAWGDQLASVNVPSDAMTVVKARHVEDDVFVRLTDDDEERERWYFQTDDAGEVTGLKIHGSISSRLD